MDRKEFLVKAGLLGVGLSIIPNYSLGKESLTNQKISLIESLTTYAKEHMELSLKNNFFSEWAENEEFHYYLYVSEPNKVLCPKGVNEYIYFGTDEEAAEKEQKEFVDQGMHTLIYKREGAHDFTLTNSLLGYSNECIALLIFHEASHQHFAKKAKLSLGLEESACEVMGVFGATFFAERFDDVDLRKVKKVVKLLEKTYKTINEIILGISEDADGNEKLYRKLEAKLFSSFKKSDSFIQQRFIHPVNNAYLLKNQFFSKRYELLKSVAERDKYINTFLSTLENLPKKEERAVEELVQKVNSKQD